MVDRTGSRADTQYLGKATYEKVENNKPGVAMSHLIAVQLGAVTTPDADGIATDVTATGAGQVIAIDGALASGGVATLTPARNIVLTSTGNDSARTMTITGTDVYGETVKETITCPNAGTSSGKKAFKTVTSITISGATASTSGIDVGDGPVLGLPYRISTKGDVLGIFKDGAIVAGTIVAGLATGTPSTATTADVRGTVHPTGTAGGALMSVMVTMGLTSVRTDTKVHAYGGSQFSG